MKKEKKKGGCLSTILKFLAAFIVVFFIMAMLDGGDSDTNATTAVVETPAEESTEVETTVGETTVLETTEAETTAEETTESMETTAVETTQEETAEVTTEALSEIEQMRNYLLQFDGAEYFVYDMDDDTLTETYEAFYGFIHLNWDDDIDIDACRTRLYDSDYAIYTEEQVDGYTDYEVIDFNITLEEDYWALEIQENPGLVATELTIDNYRDWYSTASVGDEVSMSVYVISVESETLYCKFTGDTGTTYRFYLSNINTSEFLNGDVLNITAEYDGSYFNSPCFKVLTYEITNL
ncbi:MAG: hypothetical protein LUE23_10615 [Lachnospiraceae bacterium]|nr:hypothetical protein [Lachnospiraceae bacterium]